MSLKRKLFCLTADQKKEICIYHSYNSNKSQQHTANVLLQISIFKTSAVAVHMTCIEYRHAHSVVSRYPANLASRQKYTSDEMWRDNEVRLYFILSRAPPLPTSQMYSDSIISLTSPQQMDMSNCSTQLVKTPQ